jgi:hypothetical protein
MVFVYKIVFDFLLFLKKDKIDVCHTYKQATYNTKHLLRK